MIALLNDYSYGTLSYAQSQIKTGGLDYMILRRALASALFGLAVAAVAPVTAANAAAPADYPPDANVSLTLSATVITVGSSVTASGSGFAANSTVSVTSGPTGQGFAGDRPTAGLGSFAPAGAAAAPAAVQRLAAVGVATDASGSFSTTLSFDQIGTFVVTATGPTPSGGTDSASATLEVIAADSGVGGDGSGSGSGSGSDNGSGNGASGVGGLPNTGASIGLPVTLGAILVLGGAGLLTAVRRRKRSSVAA